MEARHGEPGLPRRALEALVLRAVHPREGGGLGEIDGDHDRAVSQGDPGRRSYAELRGAQAHDEPGAHAEAHRQQSAGVTAVQAWASTVGPMTEAMVQRLIEANPVREQGWRSARGLQRVGEKYGPERTEQACRRALRLGARSYKPIANILAL